VRGASAAIAGAAARRAAHQRLHRGASGNLGLPVAARGHAAPAAGRRSPGAAAGTARTCRRGAALGAARAGRARRLGRPDPRAGARAPGRTDDRPAGTGRNPTTGAEIAIAAANTVKFTAGKAFKEAVNES